MPVQAHVYLVVVVPVAHAVGEEVAGQLLDSVLEHVAHHQGHEQGHGEVAVAALEREGYGRGHHHRDARRQAVEHLLGQHAIAALAYAHEQEALGVFLEHPHAKDEGVVAVLVLWVNHGVALLLAVAHLIVYQPAQDVPVALHALAV